MSVIIQPTIKHTASVIFLHGLGDTGHGWASVFGSIKKPHIKYIFPTASMIPITLNGGMKMNAWFDVTGLKPDAKQDEVGIQSSSKLLLSLVDAEIASGIPSERIFIGGFSQGGASAMYSALASPHRFAGVLALSTWLPLHYHFPAHLQAKDLTLPILQCHGDQDPMVPLDWSKLSTQALTALGFSALKFKVYKGMGHSSTDEEMDDIKDFIHSIVPN